MIGTSRLPAYLAVAAGMVAPAALAAPACEARSGPNPPAVVELYTSEGCSSCPPADRWLSALPAGPGVLALSFHVNYWNHLGWRDPFATPETTERQYRLKQALGAPYVYTPQVVLNGRDLRGWRQLRPSGLVGLAVDAAPALQLSRTGNMVTASIAAVPGRGAGVELAGYWAVLQDSVVSRVTRGENAGEVLRHDHVVTRYQPVPIWRAVQGASARLELPAAPNQRVAFVVTDATMTRPVQALALKCPA